MSADFGEIFFIVVVAGLSLFTPVAIVLIYLKRRRAKQRIHAQADGAMKGTAADLEASEVALQNLPMDIRETLLETHELYDRFSTHRGYSNIYMESLTKAIRDTGLDCQIVFQASLPMGVADAVLEPQGMFELYIPRGKLNEARKTIPALIETAAARV